MTGERYLFRRLLEWELVILLLNVMETKNELRCDPVELWSRLLATRTIRAAIFGTESLSALHGFIGGLNVALASGIESSQGLMTLFLEFTKRIHFDIIGKEMHGFPIELILEKFNGDEALAFAYVRRMFIKFLEEKCEIRGQT